MKNLLQITLTVVLAGLLTHACNDVPESVDNSEPFQLRWEVVSNFIEGGRTLNEITLINNSDQVLEDDWYLYFNNLRLIDVESLSEPGSIEHINGDFYRIRPWETFQGLEPGDEVSIRFEALGASVIEMDSPDGAYIAFSEDEILTVPVSVVPFERDEQLNRMENDAVPVATAEALYEKNAYLKEEPPEQEWEITPTPVSVSPGDGNFILTENTGVLYQEELANEAGFLSSAMEPVIGTALQTGTSSEAAEESVIELVLGSVAINGSAKDRGDQAYRLDVSPSGITITGTDPAGVFYGIQSLRSLIPVEYWHEQPDRITLPAVVMHDAPGLSYRGLHLDVSRNFQSVEQVKKLLDVMAFYKLNKFHFHITDDEGWRLAINAFPELTQIGARRGHTLTEDQHLVPSYGSGPDPDPEASMGSGWYTQQDYMDILQYATDRHIEVIPEVDVPGHARAALIAMETRYNRLLIEAREDEAERYRIHDPEDESEYMSIQRWDDNVINVCQESTYRFLEVVFDEIITMHREAGAPLTSIHVGGDEVPYGVWEESPVCENLIAESDELESVDDLMDYFFYQTEQSLTERGLAMSAWEEFSLLEDHDSDGILPNPLFVDSSIPYVWSNIWGTGTESYSYQLANAGYEIVMSHASNFYFDLSYQKHPEEAGLFWAGFVDTRDPYAFIPFDLYKSGVKDYLGRPMAEDAYDDFELLTEEGKENILGLQGQLWSETFRTPSRVEYMALPRIIPMAERAWAPEADWMEIEERPQRLDALEEAWNGFANRLGARELPRLDIMNDGYGYRLPPPGAVVEDGMLVANLAYPGLDIRYTTDGSEPTVNATRYEGPVAIGEDVREVKLRSFNSGTRGSRVSTLQIGS